jgi:hypothetical protein
MRKVSDGPAQADGWARFSTGHAEEHLQNIANRLGSSQTRNRAGGDVKMIELEGFQPATPHDPQRALQQARQARIEAELAGCEMEELAAVLHRKPPVGRWPQFTRASFGPSVAVLSG